MSDPIYPLTISTIGDLIDTDRVVVGWCVPDSTSFEIDLQALADQVGREWVFIRQKWPVRCPHCGADVEIRIGARERRPKPQRRA
jgi:hypothetical protein